MWIAGLRTTGFVFGANGEETSKDDKDEASIWHKVFNISRSEDANLRRLGLSSSRNVVPDKIFQKLSNSITPKGLGGGTNFNWGSSTTDTDDLDADGIASRKVTWSIFDIFENDLGPNEPRPRVIHAASLFAQLSLKLLTCLCFWSVWYSTLLFTFHRVLLNDVKWGRDTWLFDIFTSVDIFADLLFFCLTLLRLRTTVLDVLTCMETVRPRTLVDRNLRSKGFWIDLLSCVPCATLVVRSDAPQFLLVLKMLRIRHILRRRPPSLVFQHDIMRILRLLSLVIMGGHLLSCAYFFVIYETKTFKRNPYFQLTQGPYGFFDYYTFALRSATYLVLGADLEGYSDLENAGIFCCTLLGVMVNALVFSEIIIVISRRSLLETKIVEETNNAREAMRTLDVPSSVQLRIFSHYAYERVHQGHGTIVDLLGGISEQLNFELHLARHYRLVTAVPFFKRSHPYVLREIVLVLSDVIFLPGDWICRLGDEGKEMYFLHKGCCSVLSGLDAVACLRQVRQGDYFGEISLLTGVQRTAYVRADTFSMVAELSKDKFDQIMRRFPQELQVIVTGFSEEQKTLLLKIRSQLHAPLTIPDDGGPYERKLSRTNSECIGQDDSPEASRASSPVRFNGDESGSIDEANVHDDSDAVGISSDKSNSCEPEYPSPRPSPRESCRSTPLMSSISLLSRASHRSAASCRSSVSAFGLQAKSSDLDAGRVLQPIADPDGYVKADVDCRRVSFDDADSTKSEVAVRQSESSMMALESIKSASSSTASANFAHWLAQDIVDSEAGTGPGARPKGLGILKSVATVLKLGGRKKGSVPRQAPHDHPGAIPEESVEFGARLSARQSSSSQSASSPHQSQARASSSSSFRLSVQSARAQGSCSTSSGLDAPAPLLCIVPREPGESNAEVQRLSMQRQRRPSLLGQMLGLSSSATPGSPQAAQASRGGGILSNLAAMAAEGTGGLHSFFLTRRKSGSDDNLGICPHGGEVSALRQRRKSCGGALGDPSGAQADEPSDEISSNGSKPPEEDLAAMYETMSKVTVTTTDIHSDSMLCDQLTTDIQSGHQTVYGSCARMEEIWLGKRQQIRDERRDIVTTLAHLAAQVRDSQTILRRTLSFDNPDDVTLQAFNIVQSGMEVEQPGSSTFQSPVLLGAGWGLLPPPPSAAVSLG